MKLGLTVSPRTVRRYMPPFGLTRGGRQAQYGATFLQTHAGAVLACDFFVVVTATFQRVYVFVILDIATRRVVHWNLTPHPTAEWTIQQFRNGVPTDAAHQVLVHDRDAIFSSAVNAALRSMQIRPLKTPARAPQANAHCERFIGTPGASVWMDHSAHRAPTAQDAKGVDHARLRPATSCRTRHRRPRRTHPLRRPSLSQLGAVRSHRHALNSRGSAARVPVGSACGGHGLVSSHPF